MRVFVASSSEQKATAEAVAAALRAPPLEPEVWYGGTFRFSDTYIESLENALDRADFAVVVLTGDDSAKVRGERTQLPRDNATFELGLFTGRLGRQRCFLLLDGATETRLASDLAGVKPVQFDGGAARKKGGGGRKLAAQLLVLRSQMLELGERCKPTREERQSQEQLWRFSSRVAGHWWERMRKGEDDKSALSYMTITVDNVTNTPKLEGVAYGLDGSYLAKWSSEVSGVTPATREIFYRWKGEHKTEHEQTYGGGGRIQFDDAGFETANGYFYDTNFSAIAKGADLKEAETRVKNFALYRCSRADEKVMASEWTAEAKKLRLKRMKLDGR